jgi:hypothetical protein
MCVCRAYRDKTGKMRPPLEALRPCYSVFTFIGLCSFWVLNSPNNVIEVDPRAVYFMTGTIFSNICVKPDFFLLSKIDYFLFAVSIDRFANVKHAVRGAALEHPAADCNGARACAGAGGRRLRAAAALRRHPRRHPLPNPLRHLRGKLSSALKIFDHKQERIFYFSAQFFSLMCTWQPSLNFLIIIFINLKI